MKVVQWTLLPGYRIYLAANVIDCNWDGVTVTSDEAFWEGLWIYSCVFTWKWLLGPLRGAVLKLDVFSSDALIFWFFHSQCSAVNIHKNLGSLMFSGKWFWNTSQKCVSFSSCSLPRTCPRAIRWWLSVERRRSDFLRALAIRKS